MGTSNIREGTEALLGRRLRPWWGKAPGRLAARGLVGAALFAGVVYVCSLVRSGDVDLEGTGFEDRQDTFETLALVVGALAAVAVIYRAVQLVVGVMDLIRRQEVVGTVVSARRRRTGDFLPGIVQTLWYRGEDGSGRSRATARRTRYEVVLDTPEGLRSWNVGVRVFSGVIPGTSVRLTASPLVGHVSRIDPID